MDTWKAASIIAMLATPLSSVMAKRFDMGIWRLAADATIERIERVVRESDSII